MSTNHGLLNLVRAGPCLLDLVQAGPPCSWRPHSGLQMWRSCVLKLCPYAHTVPFHVQTWLCKILIRIVNWHWPVNICWGFALLHNTWGFGRVLGHHVSILRQYSAFSGLWEQWPQLHPPIYIKFVLTVQIAPQMFQNSPLPPWTLLYVRTHEVCCGALRLLFLLIEMLLSVVGLRMVSLDPRSAF